MHVAPVFPYGGRSFDAQNELSYACGSELDATLSSRVHYLDDAIGLVGEAEIDLPRHEEAPILQVSGVVEGDGHNVLAPASRESSKCEPAESVNIVLLVCSHDKGSG